MTYEVLDRLVETIEKRKKAAPESSYTAQLLSGGNKAITKKIGEEATEVVIAALSETSDALTGEVADLLYHILVLLAANDISLDEVLTKLAERQHISGIEEKNNRT